MIDEMLVGVLAMGAIVGAVVLERVQRPNFEEEKIRYDISDCVISLQDDVLPNEAFESCSKWYRHDQGKGPK